MRAAVFTHGEQKNGAIVRHLVGYDRFASEAAYVQLARVYELGRLHVNFFQPVEKLVSKTRVGAHTRRYYDRPDSVPTPVCLPGAAARPVPALDALHQRLNPMQLRRDLEAALERLWTLAAPDPQRAQGNNPDRHPRPHVPP